MIKKVQISASILLLLCFALAGAASAEQANTGAVVKLPYPLSARELSLESQKVRITVYSTFVQVEADYAVRNESAEEVTATLGFPITAHSSDSAKGESVPIGFQVTQGKRDDLYVKQKIEGTIDPKEGSFYKEWYGWDIDIAPNKTTRFKVQYFLKLNRDKGIPHLTYELSKAKEYSGDIKESVIIVDMPMDAERLPFTTEKFASNDSYIYSSLPKPVINKNILTWNLSKHKFDRDLELYFYANGYPDWEVKCSEEQFPTESGANLMDGNIKTFWRAIGQREGLGTWVEFKPVIRTKDGRTRHFGPKVVGMGVIPGNCNSLSDFYNFTHLREADVEVVKAPPKEDPKELKKENPFGNSSSSSADRKGKGKSGRQPSRDSRNDLIFLDCNADWTMQVFKAKAPLDTSQGPLMMKTVSIYPGQNFKDLCIGELMIFDRIPGELMQW